LFIKSLKIENVRNLKEAELKPHPVLNILLGANGAGKTSVLEAMVVLSRGRSFRTNQASELIGPARSFFRVFAESGNKQHKDSHFGLERSPKHWRARINGTEVSQLSELLRHLPLVIMEPNSHLLVSGSPEVRRKYLDWGMFHVEHGYLETWKRFSKILKQRNAALRRGQTDILDSIDDVFVELGIKLSEYRENHSKAISNRAASLLADLSPGLDSIKLNYARGWNKEAALKESLITGRENDLTRGSTGSGPHRADLKIRFRETAARNILSRGEQKILSAALLLAQFEVLVELGELPLLLLDDLASEFDTDHYRLVLDRVLKYGGQVWVSGTSDDSVATDKKVFHVKHGAVEEVV
jgi:DNA replication and repair protein RecF